MAEQHQRPVGVTRQRVRGTVGEALHVGQARLAETVFAARVWMANRSMSAGRAWTQSRKKLALPRHRAKHTHRQRGMGVSR